MPPVVFRPVSKVDFDAFTAAFNRAYSDYFMPISMTPASFRALMTRDDLDLDVSVAALDNGAIVGTGLLGIRDRRGWIGGMGVIPGYRRQGIGRQMMRYLLDRAREHHLTEVILEVIEDNHAANELYRQIGFEGRRYLLVLDRAPSELPDLPVAPYPVETRSLEELLEHYNTFHDTPNCWQRDVPSLAGLGVHQVQSWAAMDNRQVVGYAIGWANAHVLRLVDFAAKPVPERIAIAQSLLTYLHRQCPNAYGDSYNISEYDPVLPAYEALGYTISFRQIEMQLTLAQP
ncbi:MAG TPA: GNAT family N-acetyltransferase [Aggregatilineaceae bacterium]|nr:GNAT family N-acetyltransferase [Aggregatilineaceae bacterium]